MVFLHQCTFCTVFLLVSLPARRVCDCAFGTNNDNKYVRCFSVTDYIEHTLSPLFPLLTPCIIMQSRSHGGMRVRTPYLRPGPRLRWYILRFLIGPTVTTKGIVFGWPKCTKMRIFHRLTTSTPAVPNCCCSKCSAPYWCNPAFLIFDIRALWRQSWAPERPNVKD